MNSNHRKEKIIVIQPYGIGDAIFMLPLLKALKTQKQVERIDVLLGSRTKPIIENCPYVDNILIIDKDKWKSQGNLRTLLDKCGFLLKLGKTRYSILIDVSMQPEYSFWAKFYLRIPVRIGFNYKKRGRFLTHSVDLPKEGFVKKHIIEYYVDMAALIGVDIKDKKPELKIPTAVTNSIKAFLGTQGVLPHNYIVIAPGGGVTWGREGAFRHWPLDYFAQLTALIRKICVFDNVVVIGTNSESPMGEKLEKQVKGLINLCGKTSIPEAGAVLKMAKFFIAGDGGLVHLAVSQDTPVITFYGPPDPNVYGPYPLNEKIAVMAKNINCRPCYKNFRMNAACLTHACMNELKPVDVFEELIRRDFFNKL
jgi:lipopolysaccharide heptosyltransferase II